MTCENCADLEATVRTLAAQLASVTERAETAERRSEGISRRAEQLADEARKAIRAGQEIISLVQRMEDD